MKSVREHGFIAADKDELTRLIKNARKELGTFANAKNPKNRLRALARLGWNEGLFTLMRLVQLDRNGDGQIGNEELARFQDEGKALVEAFLSNYTSDGVVVALMLSLLYPLVFEAEFSFELDWSMDFSSFNWQASLDLATFILIYISMSLALFSLSSVTALYLQLSFHMPDLSSQLWFIQRSAPYMRVLVGAKNSTVIVASLALLTHAISKASGIGVIVGLLPVIGAVAPIAFLFWYRIERVVIPYLAKQTQGLLAVRSLNA